MSINVVEFVTDREGEAITAVVNRDEVVMFSLERERGLPYKDWYISLLVGHDYWGRGCWFYADKSRPLSRPALDNCLQDLPVFLWTHKEEEKPVKTRPWYKWFQKEVPIEPKMEYINILPLKHLRSVLYREGGVMGVCLSNGKELGFQNTQDLERLLMVLRYPHSLPDWKDQIQYLMVRDGLVGEWLENP